MIDFVHEGKENSTDCRINIAKPMDNLTKYEVHGQVFYTYKNPKSFLELNELIKAKKNISAVKLHRQLTGMGLKEARNYVFPLINEENRNVLLSLVHQLLEEEPQYLI